jgi:transcriptional regulator NrdR family protein
MREENSSTATLILEKDENISTYEEGMEKKINLSAEYTIVKRNGMLVPFRRDRIFNALEAACYPKH